MIHRQVGVGKGLRLDSLRRVYHKHRTLARRKRTRNLIVKVNMSRSIYKIQLILPAVLRLIIKGYGVSLNGNAALAL